MSRKYHKICCTVKYYVDSDSSLKLDTEKKNILLNFK